MDAQPRQVVYVFGDYRLDAARRQLSRRDGRVLPLTPRVFDTLRYLLEHAGQVCTKSALLRAVWPTVVVEEGSLQQAIHELRRALGDTRRENRFIATVPGRGYQFVADLVVQARESAGPAPADAPHPAWPPPRAVAVRASRLALTALLGAVVLLAAGTAVRTGNRSDASGPEPPVRADTHITEQVRLARFLADRRQPGDLALAEQAYRQVLERAPRNAIAWAGLAGVYSSALAADEALGLTRAQALERMRDAAERALAIDPGLEEARLRHAEYLAASGDHAAYAAALQHAAAQQPRGALAHGWFASDALDEGRIDAAVAASRSAVAAEPMSLVARSNLGAVLYFAGRLDEAERELRTVLSLSGPPGTAWSPSGDPDNPASNAAISLAKTLIVQARYDEARALLDGWPEGQYRMHCLALLLYARGERAAADAVLERLVASGPSEPHWVAEVFAQRGEADAAFDWLARAAEHSRHAGDEAQIWRRDIRYSPFALALRDDPRWQPWFGARRQLAYR